MKLRKRRATLLLCCLVMGLSGCAAVIAAGVGAGVGFGTYRYVEGTLKRDYIGPQETIWEATLTAMDDLRVASEVKEKDYFGGLIKGIMHDGTKITIKMKRLTDNSTEVGVRVGVFGDRKNSETIHDKIAENSRQRNHETIVPLRFKENLRSRQFRRFFHPLAHAFPNLPRPSPGTAHSYTTPTNLQSPSIS